jgi:hypothetical protein
MSAILFNKNQNEIFKRQFEDFKEDLKVWHITNLLIPCVIILIPTFLYSFLPEGKNTFNNLLLNGSFSLLGINTLFTTSTFLINSIRLKDAKFEKDIVTIRLRLIIYLASLLILGSVIYILQIIYNIDSIEKSITIITGLSITFYFSVSIGKRVFCIKDELIGKSISESINETVRDLRKSTEDLD